MLSFKSNAQWLFAFEGIQKKCHNVPNFNMKIQRKERPEIQRKASSQIERKERVQMLSDGQISVNRHTGGER